MKKIYYNKLIRDKIPEKIKRNGGDYKINKLNQKFFETELLKKVGEEASGLLASKTKEELASELADIIAVIEEIKKLKRITSKQISEALKTNFDKKGGFNKKLFLVWSSDTGYKTNERRNK
jgi:predicted house-cleaning noncanonical NTP pyrophosphatase (MazG superfamily)